MIKPLCEMTEEELREVINKRKYQWQNAEKRANQYGSFQCIGDANSYRQKYLIALRVADNKGYTLSEEEKELSKFQF